MGSLINLSLRLHRGLSLELRPCADNVQCPTGMRTRPGGLETLGAVPPQPAPLQELIKLEVESSGHRLFPESCRAVSQLALNFRWVVKVPFILQASG